MRLNILFVTISALFFLRVIYNLYNFWLTKYYYKKYVEFVKNSKSWFVREHKQKIVSLFERAGIEDCTLPNTELAGYGFVRTGNFSVFRNISILREDVVTVINGNFHEAIGVYKQRIIDTFNPFYWIESFFQLPTSILKYIGLKPQSIIVKILQILWWLIVAVSTVVGIVFNSEFVNWLSYAGVIKK